MHFGAPLDGEDKPRPHLDSTTGQLGRSKWNCGFISHWEHGRLWCAFYSKNEGKSQDTKTMKEVREKNAKREQQNNFKKIRKHSGTARIFRTRPDLPWCPSSLLYNGFRISFSGLNRPGSGVNHPPQPGAEVKERIEFYFYSPSGPSWPIPGRTSLLCDVAKIKINRIKLF